MSNRAELAHRWAHQQGGKTQASNFYFHGMSIYSFGNHFEIARLLPKKAGETQTVLFTTRGYSHTTSKHISYTRSAIPDTWNIIYMPSLMDKSEKWRSKSDLKVTHKSNMESLLSEIEDARMRQLKAKSRDYTLDIERERKKLADYINYFRCRGLLTKKQKEMLEGSEELNTSLEEKEAKLKVLRAKERERVAKANEKKMSEWREGKGWTLHLGRTCLLRRKGVQIETSKGVKLDYAACKLAYRLLRMLKNKFPTKEEIRTKLEEADLKLGGWGIRDFSPTGNLLVGCHYYEWSEIERLAKQEQWA